MPASPCLAVCIPAAPVAACALIPSNERQSLQDKNHAVYCCDDAEQLVCKALMYGHCDSVTGAVDGLAGRACSVQPAVRLRSAAYALLLWRAFENGKQLSRP